MRHLLLLYLLGSGIMLSCFPGDQRPTSSAKGLSACQFDAPPMVLMERGDPTKRGSELLQMWTLRDDARVWKSAVDLPAQKAFVAQLGAKGIKTEAGALLEQSDAPNNVLVRSNTEKWIHPINCIEWLQFSFQNRRIPVLERPTEFVSYMLRSPDKAGIRIFYYTKNEDGIGRLGPLSAALETARAEGWQVLASLHSHNFHLSHPAMNGILAPSGPDSQLYKAQAAQLGLREAWITNGVQTFRMSASHFDKLADDETPLP